MQVSATNSTQAGTSPSTLNGLAVVAISDGQRAYGLYRVKQVATRTIVLGHGAISFPVGMHLDIKDYKEQPANSFFFQQRATVVENGRDGIRLVW